jgi:hypothetical protein
MSNASNNNRKGVVSQNKLLEGFSTVTKMPSVQQWPKTLQASASTWSLQGRLGAVQHLLTPEAPWGAHLI